MGDITEDEIGAGSGSGSGMLGMEYAEARSVMLDEDEGQMDFSGDGGAEGNRGLVYDWLEYVDARSATLDADEDGRIDFCGEEGSVGSTGLV